MQAKELAQLLMDKGLLDRGAAASAQATWRPEVSFADHLVSQGAVQEADLLRAVAQALEVRFISSGRLSTLRVTQDVLDRIPLAAAQQFEALPIAFDASQKTLTIAMADPSRVAALDNLPDVARANHVVAVVALPAVIREATRRLYGLARREEPRAAPAPAPAGSCAHCQTPYFADQLECAQCGLLLNPDAPVDRTHNSIVRALLARPSGEHAAPARAPSHDAPTRLGFVVPVTDEAVPEISGNLDIVRSLAELEAFLLTWVDGEASVGDLSQLSGLVGVEVRSIVASLVERGVLRFRELPPPSAQPQPQPQPQPPQPRAQLPPQPSPSLRPESKTALAARAARQQDLLSRFQRPAAQPPEPLPAPAPAPAAAPARRPGPPSQDEATLARALAHERQGDIDGAVAVLRAAIAKASSPGPLYNRLAVLVLNRRRDAQQAQELLHKAIELEPENPVYRQNLLKVLALLG